MRKTIPPGPPRIAGWLLRLGFDADAADSVLGDLEEELATSWPQGRPVWPAGWYVWQAVVFLLGALRSRGRSGSSTRRRVITRGAAMDDLLHDLRYAARRTARAPGFALTVIVTLALGIGANAGIFSLVDTALLKPLPLADPARLVTVRHFYGERGQHAPISVPGFRDYGERARSFSALAAGTGWAVNFTGAGEPERLTGVRVIGDWAGAVGVQAALGRTLVPEDGTAGRERVVVMAYGFWQRRFGGDRSVVGSTMTLDGEPFTVIGVMPETFRDPFNRQAQLWAPRVFPAAFYGDDFRTTEWLQALGRLAPGATLESARVELRAIAAQLVAEYPDAYPPRWSLDAVSLSEWVRGDLRTPLVVLLGSVGMVLLIACANVANLLLVRGAGRRRELAVRAALGAGRARIGRQLVTESLLLAIAGGALGLAVGWYALRAFLSISPAGHAFAEQASLDARVVGFTMALSLITGLLFGAAPAYHAGRTDVQTTLRESGRSAEADRQAHRLRRGLVVLELALALTLLAGAGMLMRSFARLTSVDPGFEPEGILTFNVTLPLTRYGNDTARLAFFDRLLAELRATPGVDAAAVTNAAPFAGDWWTGSFGVEGFEPGDDALAPWGDNRMVTPDFRSALAAPLLRGRFFEEADRAGAPRVAVIDEVLARRYFGDRDPIGRRIDWGAPGASHAWEVVGVIGHMAHEALDADPRPQLYVPFHQHPLSSAQVVMRAAGDPERLVEPVRAVLRGIDPQQPIWGVATMTSLMHDATGGRRLSLTLLSLFAGLALLLAAVGIYGVMAQQVQQRTAELGLRMALGADRRSVLRLVLAHGLRIVAVGVVLGIIGALTLTRFLHSQLYGIRPGDPGTVAAVVLVLATIALIAMLLPALRATRVDPLVALRQET